MLVAHVSRNTASQVRKKKSYIVYLSHVLPELEAVVHRHVWVAVLEKVTQVLHNYKGVIISLQVPVEVWVIVVQVC